MGFTTDLPQMNKDHEIQENGNKICNIRRFASWFLSQNNMRFYKYKNIRVVVVYYLKNAV